MNILIKAISTGGDSLTENISCLPSMCRRTEKSFSFFVSKTFWNYSKNSNNTLFVILNVQSLEISCGAQACLILFEPFWAPWYMLAEIDVLTAGKTVRQYSWIDNMSRLWWIDRQPRKICRLVDWLTRRAETSCPTIKHPRVI